MIQKIENVAEMGLVDLKATKVKEDYHALDTSTWGKVK